MSFVAGADRTGRRRRPVPDGVLTSTLIRQSFLKMVCGSHVFLHGTLWGKGLGSAGPGTAVTDYPRSSWGLSTHPQLGHVLTAFSLQTWLRDGLSDGLVVG